MSDAQIVNPENFTPKKVQTFPVEKFSGVSIKQFPRDIDHGDIFDYLIENGLPEDKKEVVEIKDNGNVIISNLDSYIVEYLINSIHGKIKFGRKLFCNGVVELTPKKPDLPTIDNSGLPLQCTENTESSSRGEPVSQSSLLVTGDQSIDNLVRRHSLSLVNRSPNKGSLAEELLQSKSDHNFQKTTEIIDEIKNMTGRLSDFASCISSDVSSNYSTNEEIEMNDTGFQTVNEKRRHKKSKRKSRQSPPMGQFLKKPNLNVKI